MNTRWKDLFNHLKKEGFDVYPPNTKQSDCTSPYIVVRDSGITEIAGISSNTALFDLLIYIPKNQYSKIEEYRINVQKSMNKLFPLFRPAHMVTTPFFDDTVNGWTVSVQYQNYQKQERR